MTTGLRRSQSGQPWRAPEATLEVPWEDSGRQQYHTGSSGAKRTGQETQQRQEGSVNRTGVYF